MTRPLNALQFGAKPDGTTDNGEALQDALDAAYEEKRPLLVPRGVFAYGRHLDNEGVDFLGEGVGSVLHALNTDDCAVFMRGCGAKVRRLKFSGVVPTVRTAPWETVRIVAKDFCEDFLIAENTIETSSGGGIMVDVDAHHGVIRRNYVHDTLADSIHLTGRCHHMLVEANQVRNSGDDGVAVVSYHRDLAVCHNIEARGNDIRDNKWGRCMSVVGGTDVLYWNNYIANNAFAAGFIFAQEEGYDTYAAKRVTCRHNTVVNCGNVDNGHWAILAVAGESEPNEGLLIERNLVQTDGDRGGIDVRDPSRACSVDQNVVVASQATRLGAGVAFTPYSDGAVGMLLAPNL